jgi:hypothetical protein
VRNILRRLYQRSAPNIVSASEEISENAEVRSERDRLIDSAKSIAELVRSAGLVGGAFVDASVLKAFQAEGLSLSYNHYYSVIPDLNHLPQNLWDGQGYSRAWSEIKADDYRPLLNRILNYVAEIAETPSRAETGFFWDNPMFPPLDAIAYYGIIRDIKPSKVLEIGSGYSTHLAVRALEQNGQGTVTCVEPFPEPFLLELKRDILSIDSSTVQDAPLSIFESLRSGDVLFIDTSHTIKTGSDVNYILFEVLPRLASGVWIHIHDFFAPFEYPKHWFDDIGIIWNEQYAILAFLMNNDRYKVVLPNYLASVESETVLAERLAGLDIWDIKMNLGGARGASLWLTKL